MPSIGFPAGKRTVEFVAIRHEACLRFRSLGAHPGVAEVDDGDDRRSRIHNLALPRGPHGNRSRHRGVDFRVAEAGFGLGQLGARIGHLRLVGGHVAGRSALLVGPRDGGVQVSLCRIDIFLRTHNHGLLRFQLLVGAYPVLFGFNPRLGQRNHALRVALNPSQVSLRLHQRGFRCRQSRLRIHHAAVGFAQRLRLGGTQRRNLRIVGADHGFRRILLCLKFGGVDLGDQVSGLDLRSFIHVQLLNPPHDLGTHDHLIGIHDSDEHRVGGAIGGVEVVPGRDRQQNE